LKPDLIEFREEEMKSGEKRRWKDETSNYVEPVPSNFQSWFPSNLEKRRWKAEKRRWKAEHIWS
jgi:hypothetical protein